MSIQLIGIDPTAVALASPAGVPGFKAGTLGSFDDPLLGYREFIYGQFAGTQTSGQSCVEGAASAWSPVTTVNSAPGQVGGFGTRVGVAQAAGTVGQWGWFQVFGACPALTAGAVVVGTRLNTTATAGAIDDDGTVGARVINGAVFKTAAAGAAVSADCRLSYPTVGVTL